MESGARDWKHGIRIDGIGRMGFKDGIQINSIIGNVKMGL